MKPLHHSDTFRHNKKLQKPLVLKGGIFMKGGWDYNSIGDWEDRCGRGGGGGGRYDSTGGRGGGPPPPSISRWEREMCTDCLPVCTVREREMKKSQGIRIFQVLKSPNTYVLGLFTT